MLPLPVSVCFIRVKLRLTLLLLISCVGIPSLAILIAGARISSSVKLPDPNSLTVFAHPAAAPGTVTALRLFSGISR